MSSPEIPHYKGDRSFTLQKAIDVTIHHGADPNETFDVISITIPAEHEFTVPYHYHPKATEWMKLLEGEAEGIINGEKRILKAGDDWLELPPCTKHSFIKRGGRGGKRVTWLERAGPDADMKKRFFEDFFGDGEQPGFLGAMATFYRDGDSFPVLPGGRYTDWIGQALVYLVGGFAHSTGLARPSSHWVAAKSKAA